MIELKGIQFAIGLEWKSSKPDSKLYASVMHDDTTLQYGGSEKGIGNEGLPSLAAYCANTFHNGIAIASIDDGSDTIKYWVCVLSEGYVDPQSDVVVEGTEALDDMVNHALHEMEDGQVHQLCKGYIELNKAGTQMFDIDPNGIQDHYIVTEHGLSKLAKLTIAVAAIAVVAAAYGFNYIQDKNSKLAARSAAIAQSESEIAEARELRNIKLNAQDAKHALNILAQIKRLPEYVGGWTLKSTSWNSDGSRLSIEYMRLDGSIDSFKKNWRVTPIADVSFDLNNIKSVYVTMKLDSNVRGDANRSQLRVFTSQMDMIVSKVQLLNSFHMLFKTVFLEPSEISPAMTWRIETISPEFALDNLHDIGFVINQMDKTRDNENWIIIGEYYALP